MRFGGMLGVLGIGAWLWASAAVAQPVIVAPPNPDELDPPPSWDLDVETPIAGGLAEPRALVFFGDDALPDFFVTEKNTGIVRHFVAPELPGDPAPQQPIALDLAVDNCGERGLVGLALHPAFDPTPTPVTEPPTERPPEQDWVYLSYFTDAGRSEDGCDGDALLVVERRTWNGTQLVPDTSEPPFVWTPQTVASTTAVSGQITVTPELETRDDPDDEGVISEIVGRLYVVIGSGERALDGSEDGALQNKAAPPEPIPGPPAERPPFDDTSVVLRLDEHGGLPNDNPLTVQPTEEVPEPVQPTEARYVHYGFREARAITIDPVITFAAALWFSEQSDTGKPHEVTVPLTLLSPVASPSNGGYRDNQGLVDAEVLETQTPYDKDREVNEDYPLFDMLLVDDPKSADDADKVQVNTYVQPAFTFEDDAMKPGGLGFGGFESGPQHAGDLFLGLPDGRLLRFPVNSSRNGFLLSPPLTDLVANVAVPGDPDADPPVPDVPADDLGQILIGTGFGDIAHIERAPDGAVWVVDRAGGAVHRVFWNATHDVAAAGAKVAKKITLSAKKPTVTKSITVTIENPGVRNERMFGDGPTEAEDVADLQAKLDAFLGITLAPAAGFSTPAGCSEPLAKVVVPWYAQPPYPAIIGIGVGGDLRLEVAVTWSCTPPFTPGATPYEMSFTLDSRAIGIRTEPNQANNACPRAAIPPDPMDPDDEGEPGCGAKGGGPFVTNLILK